MLNIIMIIDIISSTSYLLIDEIIIMMMMMIMIIVDVRFISRNQSIKFEFELCDGLYGGVKFILS